MKKFTTIAFIFVMFLYAGSALAQSGDAPLWVSGEVTSIFQDQDGALISLKMADGQPYNISATRDQIKDLEIGDNITVEIYRGWAELIEKGEAQAEPKPKAGKKERGPQWVAGTVVGINEDATNSLLSIKLSNDKVFNVSAANDKITDIKVGDYITVKILKGWAQKITKK